MKESEIINISGCKECPFAKVKYQDYVQYEGKLVGLYCCL